MTGPDIVMTLSIADYPTTDPVDWECATNAALGTCKATGAPFGVVATLPELMPENVGANLMAGGVVPFMGLAEELAATQAAAQICAPAMAPICLPGQLPATQTLTEAASKAALAAHGLPIPRNASVSGDTAIAQTMTELRPPFAIKGAGLVHKSDHAAVRLNVDAQDAVKVASDIGTAEVLIEEMITDPVVELLVGVTRDPAHGYVFTLGAGGILTEVIRDTTSMLLPVKAVDIEAALNRLNCAPLLHGYRGKPAADVTAITSAILAVQSYVLANVEAVNEVEFNPLLRTPDRAVAVDAFIRKA